MDLPEIVDPAVKPNNPEGALTFWLVSPSTESLMAVQSESMNDQRAVPVRQEPEAAVHARAHHDRGLLAIGLFKLGKALLFFSLGLGAIHLLHKDLGDEVLRLAKELKFDPESKLVT